MDEQGYYLQCKQSDRYCEEDPKAMKGVAHN